MCPSRVKTLVDPVIVGPTLPTIKNSPVELADAEAEYRGVGIEDRRSCQ